MSSLGKEGRRSRKKMKWSKARDERVREQWCRWWGGKAGGNLGKCKGRIWTKGGGGGGKVQERRKMRRNLNKWTGGMIKGKTLNHIFIFS